MTQWKSNCHHGKRWLKTKSSLKKKYTTSGKVWKGIFLHTCKKSSQKLTVKWTDIEHDKRIWFTRLIKKIKLTFSGFIRQQPIKKTGIAFSIDIISQINNFVNDCFNKRTISSVDTLLVHQSLFIIKFSKKCSTVRDWWVIYNKYPILKPTQWNE